MSASVPAEPRHVFLDAVLQPHRSLPLRNFRLLMLGLFCLSVAVGIASVSVGAWPIVGFFGLDVALIYLAFRLSYRAARLRELVRLTDESFTVERISIHGARRSWRFEPFWLRIRVEGGAEDASLSVGSHGKSIVLGAFLAPHVRLSFAEQLRDALRRWRAFIESRDAQ